jgi:fumarate hydratase class II
MNTNSANSIGGSVSAAARALAASLPAAKQELGEGAVRAARQVSAGLDEARDRIDDGRTRLTDALEAAVAATRSGLRNYRSQAEGQIDAAADRAQELRDAVAARSRDGLAYSAELSAQAAEQLQSISKRLLKSAMRHPYVAVGVVAGACYLLVRRLTRRPASAKTAAAKRRATRSRANAGSVRKEKRAPNNGSASA